MGQIFLVLDQLRCVQSDVSVLKYKDEDSPSENQTQTVVLRKESGSRAVAPNELSVF